MFCIVLHYLVLFRSFQNVELWQQHEYVQAPDAALKHASTAVSSLDVKADSAKICQQKSSPKLSIVNHLRYIFPSPLPGTVERPSADEEMSCASQVTE